MKIMFLLGKNRKGVSNIIGYVLLIAISIGLSVFVFNWLKFYVEDEDSNGCPEGVNLVIQNYTCSSGASANLELTLKNKGRFSTDGFIVRANNRTNAKIGVYTLMENTTEIRPGQEFIVMYNLSSYPLEDITFVEVQSFVVEGADEFVCKAVASQKVICG
jgi:hypothetical protein